MKTSTTGLRFPKARGFRWELPIAVLVGWFSTVVSAAQTPTTYEIVHAFRNSGQPRSNLVEANGYFYGTSYYGGGAGVGSIFRMDQTGNLTTLHSLAYADGAFPVAGLVLASDGNFYGTATFGGTSDLGTIFRMDGAGNLTRLHSFGGDDGASPSGTLIQANDGAFYGTTSSGGADGLGTVYRADSSGSVVTLHSFASADGISPLSGVIQGSDGNFYGTASTPLGSENPLPGIIFKMDPSGQLTVLHTFAVSDGWNPVTPLIQATGGQFYGTTFSGGDNGTGTIFRIDSAGNFATLHVLSGDDLQFPLTGLIQGSDGSLYGTAYGGWPPYGAGATSGVFRVDLSGNLTELHRFAGADGLGPRGGLFQASDGYFYGTTAEGGAAGVGTIFKIDSLGNFNSLQSLPRGDGERPMASVLQATSGDFFGTTQQGGANGYGTVFKMDASGNTKTLHSFDASDGARPVAALIEATDGSLYGTTSDYQTSGMGTIFKIDANGVLTTVHSLSGDDGLAPWAALLQGVDGDFYGTTSGGGASGGGTIFRVDASGDFAVLSNLPLGASESPSGPFAPLIQATDGNFYGTSIGGGLEGTGTCFRMKPTGDIETLSSFGSAQPLVEGGDLVFYGTSTSLNGVFKLDSGGIDFVHVFSGGAEGSNPDSLLLASDGYFYGTTYVAGANGAGTIFKMDSNGNVSLLHDFDGIDGASTPAALIEASDGRLYGSRPMGGPLGGEGAFDNGSGVIFRLSPDAVAVNEIAPNSGSATGGTAIDVVGGGFVTGATVMIGGVSATDVAILDPTFLYLFTPALLPGTLNDVMVTNQASSSTPTSATHPKAFFADFLDVPQTYLFHEYVEKIFRAGVTAGCGVGNYCPDDAVTRAQMAVFLLKAEHGSGYVPPQCQGHFADVTCPSQFADWIEQLAAEGITAGCGGGDYCPNDAVTRAQMAVFLLKVEHGSGYAPPPCTGVFGDVECPSLFGDFIEQLAGEGITGGCGGGNYCPGDPNTRGQMAVFLTKTFHLP
jgi:uncharacterized repeat protein (TIGR03803 family)